MVVEFHCQVVEFFSLVVELYYHLRGYFEFFLILSYLLGDYLIYFFGILISTGVLSWASSSTIW